MNARLKKQFIDNGWAQVCELKLEGCLKSWALSWAHSKKSRFLITDDDWMEAALACPTCHKKIEDGPHDEMKEQVLQAIARRS